MPAQKEKGDDLSKLIINNYILYNKELPENEKLKLVLKYQILTKNTSLFAEVELSEKITDEMKLKIIGDKENNIIPKKRERYYEKECKRNKKKAKKAENVFKLDCKKILTNIGVFLME